MLVELRGPRPRGHRRAAARARPGHDRAHRRDRRGQDPASSRPSSCSSAGGPTPRWCAPAPTRPWSRAGSSSATTRSCCARVVPGRRAGRGPTSTAAWPPSPSWPSAGARARRPPRPARPPVAARAGRAARRPRPLRRRRPRAAAHGAASRARRRSTQRWPPSAATSGRGPGRSTCCASRSTRSTPPPSPTPTRTSALDAEEERPGRRRRPTGRRPRAPSRRCTGDGGAPPTPWPSAARPRSTGGRRSPRPRRGCAAVAAELADVAAELRDRGRGHRGRPRAPGRGPGAPPAAARAAPQVRRDAGRGARRGATPPSRAWPSSRATTPRRRSSTPSATAAPGRGRGRRGRGRAPPGAAAAGPLAEAVEAHLAELAMPKARLEVEVGGDRRATTSRSASPPTRARRRSRWPRWPRAASWPGPCSPCAWCSPRRPPTLVFDEVDAGIGGAAALAVGRVAGRARRDDHQVLVVTHLPQVAAFADAQVVVDKQVEGDTTAHHGRRASTATSGSSSCPGCCRARPTRPPPASTPASCSTPAAVGRATRRADATVAMSREVRGGAGRGYGVIPTWSRPPGGPPMTKHIFVTGGVASALWARGSPPRRSVGCSRPGACGSRCRSSTRTSTSTRAR